MFHKKDLGYVYLDRSNERMITVNHLRDTHFDEHYNYLDKIFLWIVLNTVVFKICTLHHILKIYGKEIIKNKKGFKRWSNYNM